MIIKKLELQGFKSFPDRTKIAFHPGITAIVGPNGTGKSNIVDGILWVLGGQRHKGLRGEKTEDIIFNGNAKKPPLGMADVSLSLGHQEEEIAINHRVFRSGESEYRLNGKAARLKDIQDALWKRAVAEKEYFVIEQGSIGLLLTSKPAEKRLLVEEAAGTAFYRDKKKEAQSKLASSEQNLIRVEDIISEVARAKNSLQRQAQAATRYRKLRERIRELSGLNYRKKLEQLERRHAEATRQHNDCFLQEKDIAFQIRNDERELAEKRKQIWEVEKALKESQDALFALESQVSRTESEKEREKRRGDEFIEKKKQASLAVRELEQQLTQLEAEASQRQRSLADLGKSLQEKKREMAETEAAARFVQENFTLLEKTVANSKEEHLRKLSELSEGKNEAVKAEKELELALRQEAKMASQVDEEKSLYEAKEKALREIESSLNEDLKTGQERERIISELKSSCGEKQFAVEELRARIKEAQRAKDEDYYSLQGIKRMEEAQRELAGRAEIPEALGRLADLIEADPEHAALIDAFWKEEAGSTVILALDFLKRAAERDLEGRFLLLSPGEEETVRPSLENPNVIGFLKSRLRPSPKIKDFLSRLREAVIVRNIKTAVELWLRFPSLNFITPQGDLLLSSGLLKLGRKEEGIFVLGQEIKGLKEKIAQRDAEIASLASALEKKIREKEAIEEMLQLELSRREELAKKVYEQEKAKIAAATEVEKIAAAVSLFSRELEVLGQERESFSLKRESLIQKTAALEEEEKSLQARVEAAEQEFVLHRGKNIQDEKDFIELRAGADLLQERFNNLSQQLRELEERKDRALKKIAATEEESRLAEDEEAQRREILLDLETKATSLEDNKRARQAELVQKETDLEKYHAEEGERDKKLAALREDLEKKKEERIKFEIVKAEIDRDLVNLEETCWQDLKKTLHEVKHEQPQVELSDAQIEEELAEAQEDLQKFKAVNLMAEEEYLSHKERYDFLVHERNDLRQSIDATQEAILKIDEESKTQFLTALAEVNKSFQEVFTLLFKGGGAEVKLVDEASPLESGVEIIAQPPGKKVQNITLLSGGEKSLTSLAFLFALFRYKPTPFCILDEVDAALDDANLSRFLDLMKNIKQDTQFIIITHNYKTIEVADYIYGTTMAEPNITKLYSVKMEKQQELPS